MVWWDGGFAPLDGALVSSSSLASFSLRPLLLSLSHSLSPLSLCLSLSVSRALLAFSVPAPVTFPSSCDVPSERRKRRKNTTLNIVFSATNSICLAHTMATPKIPAAPPCKSTSPTYSPGIHGWFILARAAGVVERRAESCNQQLQPR